MDGRVWLAVGMSCLGVLSACEQMDKQENYYASHTQAGAAGAFDKGLLPTLLPPSAQQVRELHRRQHNDRLVSFIYDPKDLGVMTATCQSVAAADVQFPALTAEWWPHELMSAQSLAQGYRFYRCAPEGGVLALREAQGLGYYWRQ